MFMLQFVHQIANQLAAATAPVPAAMLAATPMAPQKGKQIPPATQTVDGSTQTEEFNAFTIKTYTAVNNTAQVTDKSLAEEIRVFIPVNAVETDNVRDLHNFDRFKHFTANGSVQDEELYLSPESIKEAFFRLIDKEYKNLQENEKKLTETIEELEKSLEENPSDAEKKDLTKSIKQHMALLKNVKMLLNDPGRKAEFLETDVKVMIKSLKESHWIKSVLDIDDS